MHGKFLYPRNQKQVVFLMKILKRKKNYNTNRMKVRSLMLLSGLIIAAWSLSAQKQLYPTVHVEEWEEMNKTKQETMEWFQDWLFRFESVLRQFWGITLIGIIRLFFGAVQSLPSRTFVV